jgi:hypothetical protein
MGDEEALHRFCDGRWSGWWRSALKGFLPHPIRQFGWTSVRKKGTQQPLHFFGVRRERSRFVVKGIFQLVKKKVRPHLHGCTGVALCQLAGSVVTPLRHKFIEPPKKRRRF